MKSNAKFMADRVAEAIARVAITQEIPDFHTQAVAALEAMREPTDEMIDAVGSDWGFHLKDNWQAMLDAALDPFKKKEATS